MWGALPRTIAPEAYVAAADQIGSLSETEEETSAVGSTVIGRISFMSAPVMARNGKGSPKRALIEPWTPRSNGSVLWRGSRI
ncbi:hypothetical protein D3C85_1590180 [compost metagenome]